MASTASPLLPRLVSSCVAVANNAGKIIRDILKQGDLQIVQKEHAKDLQTEADRAAQRYIVSSLAAHFPKATLIGEEEESGSGEVTDLTSVEQLTIACPEHLSNLSEEEVVLWIDPVDGTSEYTQAFECMSGRHGASCPRVSVLEHRTVSCTSLLDHVTVLIGIAAQGKAVAGVVHQPYFNYQTPGAELGRTVWGVVGPLAIGGGAGHKVLLLLDGHAHAYVFASPGCKKWDTCAPEAVLVAAGGALTDIRGDLIPYHKDVDRRNSTGVLATAPGECHQTYLNKIPDAVKNNLKK
ncbi:LOW QUALITY PROTEIN: 3'(2'),5'-bisphosphate nucleotidase 1-like [Hyalella azteca]|uniref:3'(2'),5'-bisphosphate nucleotidase 1 n=1 Tax=Hyalella azteca TaxID=294128 RepID=A0A8B7NMZ1_HYAAZ|nr:LOW QUALITY PROTEIN: 3'(2'),5'-bisphosphate nucleotidase 1-like [Hyalella azteca]